MNVKLVPIIKSGALHFSVVYFKAERLYKMQRRSRRGTGARDVSRILRDLRLNENYIYQM